MLNVFPDSLETGKLEKAGFNVVCKTSGWQVASLTSCDLVAPGKLLQIERHNETDEIFILSQGRAELILFEKEQWYCIEMELNAFYNVKQGKWHHVLLSDDALVIIFEKDNTSTLNSDYRRLTEEERSTLNSKSNLINYGKI